jgi:hypothetical protein
MKKVSFLIIFLFVSCGQELRSPSSRGSQTLREFNSVTCSCSDYLDPVCGNNGAQYITFRNGCIAQCNDYDYTSGACDPNVGVTCDQTSGQVCGLPPCTTATNCPPARVYSDSCALTSAGATLVESSQCSFSL